MANSNNKHPGVYFTTNQRVRRIPVEEDKNATVLFSENVIYELL